VPKGKSRLVTCNASIEITEVIFTKFEPSKNPFIIVVANPVEIITHITQKITGLPKQNVIGTGTYLDSIRMNYLIESTKKNITSVNSIVLGEHGNTAFLSEQLSTINGLSFNSVFDRDTIEELLNSVKASAEKIKETQEATIYGVSYCAYKIFESLLTEQTQPYPVSTCPTDNIKAALGNTEIYLSLLSTVNKAGAHPLDSYHPSGKELAQLQKSVDLIISFLPKKYL
jgi:malate/lactate dehydrogenase